MTRISRTVPGGRGPPRHAGPQVSVVRRDHEAIWHTAGFRSCPFDTTVRWGSGSPGALARAERAAGRAWPSPDGRLASPQRTHQEPIVTFLYLALGVVAGILAGLFGIGGGVIMVIGLVSLMKLPFTTATGTSLGAMLLPVGLLGALEYYRRGHVDVRGAPLLALGLTLGAGLGGPRAPDPAPPPPPWPSGSPWGLGSGPGSRPTPRRRSSSGSSRSSSW